VLLFCQNNNELTPCWLTLTLNCKERITLPIVFGKRRQKFIEEALQGEWEFCTVEMVKRNGEWYAHFTLKKDVELIDEPETVIGVDLGEWNVAVAVAIPKQNPKPTKGQFWNGAKNKRNKRKIRTHQKKLAEKEKTGLWLSGLVIRRRKL